MTIIAQYCEEVDDCGCTAPVTAEYDLEIPAGNFSETIDIVGTKPFTVTKISVDEWCEVTYNNGLKLEGSVESGSHKQVVQVENACGKAVVVVNISVSVECDGEIIKDIAVKDGVVSETIQVPGGTILSASVGTATATLYGTDLVIKGKASPGPYEVKLDDSCNTVVKGNFYDCIVPKLLSTTGIADFERGTSASFSWVIAGNSIKTKNAVLPAGLSVSTTEANGQTTVTVSGTPTQNTGSGTMSVVVFNDCGTLTLTQKYTQAVCKNIRVTGEEGDSIFIIGEPGSFCKILEGYEPMEIVSFADIPRGMIATLDKIAANKYKLCVSGTPVKDPCDSSETDTICACPKVTVRNECGDTEIELCVSTTYVLPQPKYCVGLARIYKLDNSEVFDIPVRIEVIGVEPNSTVYLYGTAATSMTANSEGNAFIETTYYQALETESGVPTSCIYLKHETCAIVVANVLTTLFCTGFNIPQYTQ